ncbi:DUF4099 domain-containing protein [Mucilaginibacter rubeus]|uniref:DUF4099 domain-containing protein n=1 Tax=Mucilaginibacter rubeus TaxID=2027860 RepID=A0AAE6MHM3_9SPHI|nr:MULTISPECIES: DUF4099 domain-containing protein [Mucilaginibacter]QEM03693.1 DUF4099 domain-containing protein [Mucilaginibacter rubeus]QEM16304.1 DUF4099 domain-containing protein [Mucilaginibacter gossypii]QTE40933.1 DUF4099 domain-containing protein [Mucilaginibacter rubeus]QTE47536.1 DUF4099 domain-containing protein [Mucilaginibacter rubeus]QTE58928.1 DUF4099 domain-containing protein [Mucilaginibacter rubeus]
MFNPQSFSEKDLPLESLAAVGLVQRDLIFLEPTDKDALLGGRRTRLVELRNLEFAEMKIASLQAKLSLIRNQHGVPVLLISPVYLQSTGPTHLSNEEMNLLESRRQLVIEKHITAIDGLPKHVLIELDRETNQFLETNVNDLIAPDQVNGYQLSKEQQEDYKRGKIIELPDSTRLQFTATDSQGMRANKNELIATVNINGEEIYNSFYNLKTLRDYSHDYQEHPPTNAYLNTLANMQTLEMEQPIVPDNQSEAETQTNSYRRSR